MTERPEKSAPVDAKGETPKGDRIAKVLARAGVASRRDAERMIAEGKVSVNGKVIGSPALNIGARDRVAVDGVALAEPEPPRLWLYYKPEGLVTTERDEKGRPTVFSTLPPELPRVMSVGRLDLNSEGLLLLTNDGELKRKLELPATGWLRRYRVRIKGNPTTDDLAPLRKGVTVEGEHFQPMEVTLDRHQGANAWLTIGLREGRNREIRRALGSIGIDVNRLIRISYGPFRLGTLKPGEVEEVKPRILRDQLGLEERAEGWAKPKPQGRKPASTKKPGAAAPVKRGGPGKPGAPKPPARLSSDAETLRKATRAPRRPIDASDGPMARPAVPRGPAKPPGKPRPPGKPKRG
ncbi:MAG: pseudouridine synthase [Paracoccaceae bacterium]